MRIRKWRTLLLVIVTLALLAFPIYYRYAYTGWPSALEFRFNQRRYAAIAQHVAKMDVPHETGLYLTCDSNWSISSIQGSPTGSHKIAVATLKDGRRIVTLITSNQGHFGSYGYVYCTGPLQPGEIGPNSWGGNETSIHVAADKEWWVNDTLPNNWWVVSNNLD